MKPGANSPGNSTDAERSPKSQKSRLWRHIILFGLTGGLLITLLKWTEYRYLVVEHSIEIYGALTAATFAAFGIWLGLRLTRKQIVVKEVRVPVPAGKPFAVNSKKQEELEITPRELETLELDRQRHEQPRNRGEAFCEREHGKNPLQPRFR